MVVLPEPLFYAIEQSTIKNVHSDFTRMLANQSFADAHVIDVRNKINAILHQMAFEIESGLFKK